MPVGGVTTDQVTMATLTVERDGYFRLRYYAGSQMIASLGTFHESDVRSDLEMTQRIEPPFALLPVIDSRKRKQPLTWWKC
jgi:hypothetical protein